MSMHHLIDLKALSIHYTTNPLNTYRNNSAFLKVAMRELRVIKESAPTLEALNNLCRDLKLCRKLAPEAIISLERARAVLERIDPK